MTDNSACARALAGRLFIGGEWRDASDGARLTVEDPGTGEALTDVAAGTPEDGVAAIGAAAAAAADWAATPPRDRAEILRRTWELLMAQRAEIARLIAQESGKALTPDAEGEVDYGAEFLRWFAEEACRGIGSFATAPTGQYRIIKQLQPVGVSVLVTPWNFPLAMATRKIGPALAAGCTVVLKPASATPLTSFALAELFRQAGLPAGVLNVVTAHSTGDVVGAMLADSRVRKLSFTGSTEVGRGLLQGAAQNVLRTSMELGGNAPFVVAADADMATALDSAMVAKLRNGGQACTAANRFIVHSSRVDEFCAGFAERLQAVTVGYALDQDTQLGSMISADAVDGILELVTDATSRGAQIVVGGERIDRAGYFMQPTLLRDVPRDARCLTEEIFGPVAPVTTFDTFDEAIELANDTEFGLVSFIQTADLATGLEFADRIESGMVGINRGVVSDPAAPFGGWKQSGLGREGGHEGLLEYLETKYVAASW
ncbi:NAD-dependent succinate-semialdehyde dehydrogenase [Granulicoccus sp. GXG6511]|uniref:NAD-dependent succinate-semialdehyde dehydrogenase n=1 Tax=Granulicoccus sp. GXG6511 TaxID=3381351 RepID=UPI003D7DE4B7